MKKIISFQTLGPIEKKGFLIEAILKELMTLEMVFRPFYLFIDQSQYVASDSGLIEGFFRDFSGKPNFQEKAKFFSQRFSGLQPELRKRISEFKMLAEHLDGFLSQPLSSHLKDMFKAMDDCWSYTDSRWYSIPSFEGDIFFGSLVTFLPTFLSNPNRTNALQPVVSYRKQVEQDGRLLLCASMVRKDLSAETDKSSAKFDATIRSKQLWVEGKLENSGLPKPQAYLDFLSLVMPLVAGPSVLEMIDVHLSEITRISRDRGFSGGYLKGAFNIFLRTSIGANMEDGARAWTHAVVGKDSPVYAQELEFATKTNVAISTALLLMVFLFFSVPDWIFVFLLPAFENIMNVALSTALPRLQFRDDNRRVTLTQTGRREAPGFLIPGLRHFGINALPYLYSGMILFGPAGETSRILRLLSFGGAVWGSRMAAKISDAMTQILVGLGRFERTRNLSDRWLRLSQADSVNGFHLRTVSQASLSVFCAYNGAQAGMAAEWLGMALAAQASRFFFFREVYRQLPTLSDESGASWAIRENAGWTDPVNFFEIVFRANLDGVQRREVIQWFCQHLDDWLLCVSPFSNEVAVGYRGLNPRMTFQAFPCLAPDPGTALQLYHGPPSE